MTVDSTAGSQGGGERLWYMQHSQQAGQPDSSPIDASQVFCGRGSGHATATRDLPTSHLGHRLPSLGGGPQGPLQPDCHMKNIGVALKTLKLLGVGSKAGILWLA